MISRAQGAGPYVAADWFGKRLAVCTGECGPEVEFSSLPDHIREAFVMQDQQELPLPPHRNKLNWNEAKRLTTH